MQSPSARTGGDLGPFTLSVTVHDPGNDPPVRQVLISAFCPVCAARRGEPRRCLEADDHGDPVLVHRWTNRCEHDDSHPAVLVEVATACARPDCVLLVAERHYPFCGPECAREARSSPLDQIRITQI